MLAVALGGCGAFINDVMSAPFGGGGAGVLPTDVGGGGTDGAPFAGLTGGMLCNSIVGVAGGFGVAVAAFAGTSLLSGVFVRSELTTSALAAVWDSSAVFSPASAVLAMVAASLLLSALLLLSSALSSALTPKSGSSDTSSGACGGTTTGTRPAKSCSLSACFSVSGSAFPLPVGSCFDGGADGGGLVGPLVNGAGAGGAAAAALCWTIDSCSFAMRVACSSNCLWS